MSLNVTAHLGDLALALGELQRQFRSAARLEVARTVGEALRQFAVAAICRPSDRPPRIEDPWDESWDPAWTPERAPERPQVATEAAIKLARLEAALVLGFGGARWTFQRTRHPGAALAAGLVLLLAGLLGGPSVEAILQACTSAMALLRDDSIRA